MGNTMILRALTVLLAVLVASSPLGCGISRPQRTVGGHASEALLPLAPGSAWIYEVRDTAGRVSRLRMRVKGEMDVDSNGTKVVIVEERGGIPGAGRLESSNDLVAYYSRGGLIFRFPLLSPRTRVAQWLAFAKGGEPVLPENPAERSDWQGTYSVLAIEGSPMYELRSRSRVAASGEDVDVQAGRFHDCVRVETTVSALSPSSAVRREIIHHYTEWYAPGVGLVKANSSVDDEGRTLDVLWTELASFDQP
jgi:hypothetical protein